MRGPNDLGPENIKPAIHVGWYEVSASETDLYIDLIWVSRVLRSNKTVINSLRPRGYTVLGSLAWFVVLPPMQHHHRHEVYDHFNKCCFVLLTWSIQRLMSLKVVPADACPDPSLSSPIKPSSVVAAPYLVTGLLALPNAVCFYCGFDSGHPGR